MWVIKKTKAAIRRANELFSEEKFSYDEDSGSISDPKDCMKFGYQYLEWEPDDAR